TAADVVALVGSPAPANLRSLSLRIERCGAEGVEALLGSSWVSGLRALELEDEPGQKCSGGDMPVLALADTDSLAGLCELDLQQVHVSDEGLAALARSHHLACLASLK